MLQQSKYMKQKDRLKISRSFCYAYIYFFDFSYICHFYYRSLSIISNAKYPFLWKFFWVVDRQNQEIY